MKRQLVFSMIVACAAAAFAQNPELSLSYGGYNQMDACDCHDGWGNVNTSWGSLNASLYFPVNQKMSVGPSYTFSSTTTKGGVFHSSIKYHGVMMNVKYRYFKNSMFDVYAHGGMGVVVSHMMPVNNPNFNRTYFGVQVSPLAAKMTIGSGFSMFGEVGFGVQGIVQLGFSYQM